MTDIVAFASSLRRGSFNRALVEEGRQLPPDGMTIEPIEIGSMPFHNADVEADGDPASVTAYKQALHEADGLIIATPEYNDGVPVVLTNAVDWGARLLGRRSFTSDNFSVTSAHGCCRRPSCSWRLPTSRSTRTWNLTDGRARGVLA